MLLAVGSGQPTCGWLLLPLLSLLLRFPLCKSSSTSAGANWFAAGRQADAKTFHLRLGPAHSMEALRGLCDQAHTQSQGIHTCWRLSVCWGSGQAEANKNIATHALSDMHTTKWHPPGHMGSPVLGLR